MQSHLSGLHHCPASQLGSVVETEVLKVIWKVRQLGRGDGSIAQKTASDQASVEEGEARSALLEVACKWLGARQRSQD